MITPLGGVVLVAVLGLLALGAVGYVCYMLGYKRGAERTATLESLLDATFDVAARERDQYYRDRVGHVPEWSDTVTDTPERRELAEKMRRDADSL